MERRRIIKKRYTSPQVSAIGTISGDTLEKQVGVGDQFWWQVPDSCGDPNANPDYFACIDTSA